MKRIFRTASVVLTVIFVFAAFAVKAPPGGLETVWVERSAQAASCEGEGEPLALARKALEQAGVKVIREKRGHDGMMHIQMCGADTGQLNMFQISKGDLPRARAAGFRQKSP